MSKPIFDFYDIESLQNVFTLANFVEYENHVQIFYLVDDTYPILPADIETFKQNAQKRFTKRIRTSMELYLIMICMICMRTFCLHRHLDCLIQKSSTIQNRNPAIQTIYELSVTQMKTMI